MHVMPCPSSWAYANQPHAFLPPTCHLFLLLRRRLLPPTTSSRPPSPHRRTLPPRHQSPFLPDVNLRPPPPLHPSLYPSFTSLRHPFLCCSFSTSPASTPPVQPLPSSSPSPYPSVTSLRHPFPLFLLYVTGLPSFQPSSVAF